jgi:hypothetical protein
VIKPLAKDKTAAEAPPVGSIPDSAATLATKLERFKKDSQKYLMKERK